jgi:hypothetical protein
MAESPLTYIKPRYSFSGADCKVFICPHGQYQYFTPLESMNTISFSVHEQKGQARALGYRGVKGFARGVRTVAGSLILTVIEDNPFAPFFRAMETVEKYLTPKGWSADMEHTGTGSYMGDDAMYYKYKNMLPTLIPPLDILLLFANEADTTRDLSVTYDRDEESFSKTEVGERRAIVTDALIEGVEFVDYGQVTSIHDIVTEINMSWLARNVMPLTREAPRTSTYTEVGTQKDTSMPDVFAGEPQDE